jgi:hypothetical protein
MAGLHPFVQGLLKELPKAGTAWPEDQRKLWLDTAASIFKMIYKDASSDVYSALLVQVCSPQVQLYIRRV